MTLVLFKKRIVKLYLLFLMVRVCFLEQILGERKSLSVVLDIHHVGLHDVSLLLKGDIAVSLFEIPVAH